MIHLSKLLRGGAYPGDRARFPADGARPGPVIVWHMSRQCNLACRHCYAAGFEGAEMGRDEAASFLRFLAPLNPSALLLSGGEPLCSHLFLDFLDLAAKLGLRPSVSSNGTLIDERIAAILAEHKTGYVGISVDGPPTTHDAFRGVPGALAAALKGVRNLKASGCRVGLRFTMARPLLAGLPDIMRLCEELAVDRICFYHFIPAGRSSAGLSMLPEREETRRALFSIFDWVDGNRPNGRAPSEVLTVGNIPDAILLYLRLHALGDGRAPSVLATLRQAAARRTRRGILSVRWDGALFPDQFSWDTPIGIWRDIPAAAAEPIRFAPGGRCARCAWLELCGGNMRARAKALTGTPSGEDPGCPLTDAEILDGPA